MSDPGDSLSFTIQELASMADRPPWMVARAVSRLIARGLLQVTDGTADEAIADLRRTYGEAVNGL